MCIYILLQSTNLSSHPLSRQPSVTPRGTNEQYSTPRISPRRLRDVQTMTHTNRLMSSGCGTSTAVKRSVWSKSWTGPRYFPVQLVIVGPHTVESSEGFSSQQQPPKEGRAWNQSPRTGRGRATPFLGVTGSQFIFLCCRTTSSSSLSLLKSDPNPDQLESDSDPMDVNRHARTT